MKRRGEVFVLLMTWIALSARGDELTELAKQSQNPLSDLNNALFQNNIGWGTGPDDQQSYLLNFLPSLNTTLHDDWSLNHRITFPVIDQPLGLGHREGGLGDISYTLFCSPKKQGEGPNWGAGPIIQLPTATNSAIGSGKWALGPSVAVVHNVGPWVVGSIASQLWSFAGDSARPDVSDFQLQPFVYYNFEQGWTLAFAPTIEADWEEPAGEQWTVPLGGGIMKTFKIGTQFLSLAAQYYFSVENPTNEPDETLRATVAFLFPQK